MNLNSFIRKIYSHQPSINYTRFYKHQNNQTKPRKCLLAEKPWPKKYFNFNFPCTCTSCQNKTFQEFLANSFYRVNTNYSRKTILMIASHGKCRRLASQNPTSRKSPKGLLTWQNFFRCSNGKFVQLTYFSQRQLNKDKCEKWAK